MFLILTFCILQTDDYVVVLNSGTELLCSEFEKVDNIWSYLVLHEESSPPKPYRPGQSFRIKNNLINWHITKKRNHVAQQENGPNPSEAIVLDQKTWESMEPKTSDEGTFDEHGEKITNNPSKVSKPKTDKSNDDEESYLRNLRHADAVSGPVGRPPSLRCQEAVNRFFINAFEKEESKWKRYETYLKNKVNSYNAYPSDYRWQLVQSAKADYEESLKNLHAIRKNAQQSYAKLNRTVPRMNNRLLRAATDRTIHEVPFVIE